MSETPVKHATPGQLAAAIGQFGRHTKEDAGVNCFATPADIYSGSDDKLRLVAGSPVCAGLTTALIVKTPVPASPRS